VITEQRHRPVWSRKITRLGSHQPATHLGSLFVSLLFSLETLVPAFHQQAERSFRWPANFGFSLINAGLVAIAPVSMISAAEWASRTSVGFLNQFAVPLWASMGSTWLCTASRVSHSRVFQSVEAVKRGKQQLG
jgi:hypothetical protein